MWEGMMLLSWSVLLTGIVPLLSRVTTEKSGAYYIPLHEFQRAVIYGDARYYDPDRSPIANLFDVTSVDPKEHFLLPLVIGLLAAWDGPMLKRDLSRHLEYMSSCRV
jgi:hypothetical protein